MTVAHIKSFFAISLLKKGEICSHQDIRGQRVLGDSMR